METDHSESQMKFKRKIAEIARAYSNAVLSRTSFFVPVYRTQIFVAPGATDERTSMVWPAGTEIFSEQGVSLICTLKSPAWFEEFSTFVIIFVRPAGMLAQKNPEPISESELRSLRLEPVEYAYGPNGLRPWGAN
jgi:hypothetical protein